MPTHNSYAFLLCVVGVYYTPNTKKTFNYHICLRGLVEVGIDGIYIYTSYQYVARFLHLFTFLYYLQVDGGLLYFGQVVRSLWDGIVLR